MNVCVRNLKPQHRDTDLAAWHRAFESRCDFLGEHHHFAEFGVGDVENIVRLRFGNYKSVTPVDGIDVEKGKKPVVLGYLVRRNLACYDF